jgi:hypothetical protein
MLTIDRVEAELTLLSEQVREQGEVQRAITEMLSRDPVSRERLRRVVLEILEDELADFRRGSR